MPKAKEPERKKRKLARPAASPQIGAPKQRDRPLQKDIAKLSQACVAHLECVIVD